MNPADSSVAVANILEPLRVLQDTLSGATALLDQAVAKVAALDGYHLVGPLGAARGDLARRLPGIEARARVARDGMTALASFAGGSGPRRYLFLSQNPTVTAAQLLTLFRRFTFDPLLGGPPL